MQVNRSLGGDDKVKKEIQCSRCGAASQTDKVKRCNNNNDGGDGDDEDDDNKNKTNLCILLHDTAICQKAVKLKLGAPSMKSPH